MDMFNCAENLNGEHIRVVTSRSSVPLLFKNFIKDGPLYQWDVNKWSSVFGDKEMQLRCMSKGNISDEPCWERKCKIKTMTFKVFLENLANSQEWMYFDYKYLHEWFDAHSEIHKNVSWKQFGYPEKGPSDSTLWVGSDGAHTPAHQDVYGYNIVAQLHGKKRWILFPPETGGLKPTRVPYEESSIYSELNFYRPNNLDPFKGLVGSKMVVLEAGDALLVPRGWWHYVQNIDPLNISLNVWLPHEEDTSSRVSEAIVKIMVAQLCKDLPPDTCRLILNPNEEDIVDMPLAVLFLELETVVKTHIDAKRKSRRLKRQRTEASQSTAGGSKEVDSIAPTDKHSLYKVAPALSSEDLIAVLKGNIQRYSSVGADEEEVDGSTTSLYLTKAFVDALTAPDVVELVKDKLCSRLS